MSWRRFLARRLVGAVLTLAALSVLIFAATEVLPGDAVGVVAGADATPGERERIRSELGLDRPASERYREWVGGAVRGDLGTTLVGQVEVSTVLGQRLGNSLLLAGLGLAVTVPASIGLGLLAGLRAGRAVDRAVSTLATVSAGVPEFLTAALLAAVFAARLGLLPEVALIPLGGTPFDVPEVLVLPVMSLAVVGTALATRIIRASAADVASSPYVESARLAGVRGLRLSVRHVLPNALGPAVQALVVIVGALVGGAVVVETLFNYPGIGFEVQQAVIRRDVPLVQGLVLVLCAVTLLCLLMGDVVARWCNPALRSRS